MKYIYRLLLVFIAFLPLQLSATHTVGGEITYRSLGNNQYEITINFYRDCLSGDAEAVFDDPASVGIFDRDGLLIRELLIPFSGTDDTLSTDLFRDCLVAPNDLCVHTTTYRDTVTLEPIIGGYNIVYQRCCRNITVSNIIDPVATGATYDIWLTYEAMMKGNSSPVFGEWPPVVICVNEPLEFDHSATDQDGDSLVYKLCAPLSGASLSNPMPQPPNNPPYDTIFWEDNYDVNKMLGILGEPLTLDPVTGLLEVTPGIMGQFVVGVCVEEYDKSTGELLSRVRRDFEFNVVVCQPVIAAFSTPDLNCESLTVDFTNESEGASSYEWFFDWPSTEFTSTEKDPTFAFPDTGTYEVALIANPGTVCPDTMLQTIKLSENTILDDFDIEVFNCPDTAIVSAINLTRDSFAEIIEYRWELKTEEIKIASGKENPTFKIPLGSKGTLTLIATNSNDCEVTLTKPFELTDSIPPDYIQKTVFEACIGDSIVLDPLSNTFQSWNYQWQPADLLDDPNSATPRIFVMGDTTLTLELIAPDGSCSYTQTIRVDARSKAQLAFEAVPDCNGLTITFENLSVGGASFRWDFGDESTLADTSGEFSPTYTYPAPGNYLVTLTTENGVLCANTLTQQISVDTARLEPAFQVMYQDCADGSVTLAFQDISVSTVGPVNSWDWQLSSGQSSSDAKPSFTFTESQFINVQLTITTENGCGPATASREIEVRLLDDFPENDTIYLCAGVPTQYLNGVEGFEYNWEPDKGLDDNLSFQPFITLTESQTYNVIVKVPGKNSCLAQQKITAIVTPPIGLTVEGGGLICDPVARLTATTDVESSIEWKDSEGNTVGTGAVLEYVFEDMATLTAIATDSFGCTEVSEEIQLIEGAVNVELPDKLAICEGDSLFLDVKNLDLSDTLNYFWTSNTLNISEPNSSSPTVFAPEGMHELFVNISNQLGCSLTDTLLLTVIDSAIAAEIGFSAEVQCDGRTVVFQNTGTSKLNYKWDFGDPNTTDDSSTDFSPTYVYTTPGDYTVRLIVDHEGVEDCTDTISKVVTIPLTGVVADFNYNIDICTEELVKVSFFDQSTSSKGTITSWNWDFGPFGASSEQNPVLEIPGADSIIAKLTIETDENCSVMVEKTIIIRFPTFEFMDGDSLTICKGENVVLNEGGDPSQIYTWSPEEGLDLTNPASPIASPAQTTTYTLTASTVGAEACAASQQITVEVIPVILDKTPDTLICTSGEVTLEVSVLPDATVEWFSDNTLSEKIGEGTSIAVTPENAVNSYYVVAGSAAVNCEETDSVQVRIFDLLPLVTDTALTICYGIPTPLNPEGFSEFKYSWSPTTGLDDPDSYNPTATLTEAVTYSVTITDENENCLEIREVRVMVTPDIGLDAQPDTLICEMGELEITAMTTLDFPIEWYSDPGLTTNIGSGTAITVMPTEARTTYYAAVTDDNDCTQIDSTTVIVFNKDVGLEDTLFTVCFGETQALNPNGKPEYDYQWSPAEGLDDASSHNPIFSGTMDQTYTVTVMDVDGKCMLTKEIRVIVTPDIGLDAQPDTLICEMGELEITAMTTLDFPIEWYSDPGLTTNIGSGTAITVMPTEARTTYYAAVTDDNDCTQIDSTTVIVFNKDVGLEDTLFTVCFGETQALNPNGKPEYDYQWSPAEGLDDASSHNPIFSGTMDQTYTVTVMDVDGKCMLTKEIRVIVTPDIGLDAQPDTLICEMGELEITASTTLDFPIEWYSDPGLTTNIGSGTAITVMPTEARTTYYAAVTDDNDCTQVDSTTVIVFNKDVGLEDTLFTVCFGETQALNPNGKPEYDYQWSPAEGLDDASSHNPIFSGTMDQTYTVTVMDVDGKCMLTKEIRVIVTPDIGLDAQPDTLICEMGELEITAMTTLDFPIEWYSDPGLTTNIGSGTAITVMPTEARTTYYAAVTDDNDCTQIDSTTVIVFNKDVGLEDTLFTVCFGETQALNPNGKPEYDYQWSPAEGLDDASSHNPIFSGTKDQTYTVTVMDVDGKCMLTKEIRVIVTPDIGLDAQPDTLICEMGELEITAMTTLDFPIEWYSDPGLTTNIGSGTAITVMPTEARTTYYAAVTDDNDCTQIDSTTVIVFNKDVGLEDTLFTVCFGETQALNPNGKPEYDYQWSPAEGLDDASSHNPIFSGTMDQTYTVTVMVVDGKCMLTKEIRVIVTPDIGLDAQPDTLICEMGELEITASTTLDFPIEWYSDPGLTTNIGSGTSLTVMPTEARTTYYAAVTDDNDCTQIDSTTVIVFNKDVGLEDTLFTVCFGETQALNPNGKPEYDYQWSPAEGLDDASSHNPIFSGTMDQTYTVTVMDVDGKCMLTKEIRVIVTPDIGLDAQPDTLICEMGELEITAMTTLDFPIEWYSDPGLTTNIGSGTAITVMPTEARTTYYAAVTDDNDCTQVDSTTVIVFNKDVGLEDTLFTVCFGETQALNPNGKPEYDYQWSPAEGLDDASSHNPIFSGTMDQTYTVTVMDVDGKCMLTKEIRVIVTPDIGLDAQPDTLICEMGELEITASTTLDFPIEWYSDPGLTTNIGSGTAITVMPTEARTTYYAAVTDDNDCTQVDSTTVIVFNKDVGLEDTLFTVCFGETQALNPNGKPEYDYQWSPAEGLDDASSHNPIFSGTMDQTYTVTVMDVDGKCMLTKEIRVIVTPDIGLDAQPDKLICEMGELEITASTTLDFPIEWYSDPGLTTNIGSGTAITVMPTEARTTYYAAVTDDNDCTQIDSTTVIVFNKDVGLEDTLFTVCFGETQALNPNGKPEYDYQWSPAEGLDDASSHNPIFSGTMDQTYTVTVMVVDGKCMLTKEIRVIVTPDIGLDAQPDTLICEMGELEITASTTLDFPIEWYSDPGLTTNIGSGTAITVMPTEARTTYYAAVTDDNDCTQIDSTTVIVFNKDVGLEDTLFTVCFGETQALNPNGKPEYDYQWSPAEGLDDASSHNPIFSGTMDQTYTVTVMDVDGKCMLTKEIRVIVTPDIGLDAQPDTLICEMGELEITAMTTLDFPIEWYNDPGLTTNIGSGTSLTVMPTEARTTYYAAVTDDNDCTQVDSTTVIVFNKDVGLEDTLFTVCFGETQALNPNGKPEYDYQWSPAEGLDDASSHNPIFSGTMDQTYTVTVMDVDGKCMLTKEIRVIVTPDIGLDAQPDTLICEMGELEITAMTTLDFPIEWYNDPGLTTNIGSGTSLTVMPTEARTTYYAAVTDDNDCTQVDSTTVIVFNKDVGLEDTLFTVCFGETQALNPNGKPEYDYQWSPAEGLDDASSHNPIFSGTMDQTYTVTVMDVDGKCMLTKEIRVIVTPDIGLDAQPDTLICEMGELEITASTTLDFPIEWYSDPGLTTNIGSGTSLTVMPTEARTTYYAAVTDDNDCTQVDSTTVIVFNKDVGLEDTLFTVCFGETQALNPNGKPEYDYQWSPAEGLDDASSHNPIFSGTMSRTYKVDVMDAEGRCMLSKEVSVRVLPEIGLEAQGDTLICVMETISVSATASDQATIEWFSDAGLSSFIGEGGSVMVSPQEARTTYYVRATDDSGCTEEDSVMVIVFEKDVSLKDTTLVVCADLPTPLNAESKDIYLYDWQPATSLDDANSSNPVFTGSEDQTYTVTVTDSSGVCMLTRTIEVQVLPKPDINVTNDTLICTMEPILLSATSDDNLSFEWYADPGLSEQIGRGSFISLIPQEGSNVYYVRGVPSEDQCTVIDSVVVEVFDKNIGLGDTLITSCSTAPIELNPAGNPNYIYTWEPATGLDDPNSHNPLATLNESQTFGVTVTDVDGLCRVEKTVRVELATVIGLMAPNDTLICEAGDLELTATTETDATISWYSDAQLTNLLSTGGTLKAMPDLDSTIYYVEATNTDGCVELDSIIVEIFEFKTGLRDTIEICPGTPTPLNPDGDSLFTYTWEPETGLSLDDPSNPVATLNEPTTYQVTVSNERCSIIRTVFVDLLDGAGLTAQNDTTICESEEILISATATNTDLLQWYDDPELTVLLGEGTSVNVTPDQDTSRYYILATTDQGCTQVDTINVVVFRNNIGINPEGSTEVCLGILSGINPGGNPAYTYQWSPAEGLDLSEPHNPKVTLTEPMTYQVTVTDPESGCVFEGELFVDILAIPDVNTSGDQFICEVADIQLEAFGAATIEQYNWYDSPELDSVIGTGEILDVLADFPQRTFYIEAIDQNGCSNLDSAVVEVFERQIEIADSIYMLCPGSPTVINPVLSAPDSVRYLWSPATGLSAVDIANPEVTLTEGQTYELTISKGECSISRTIQVDVAPAINYVATQDTITCDTLPIDLEVSEFAEGVNVEWSDDPTFGNILGNMPVLTVTPTGEQLYYVRLTDENNCSIADTISVVGGAISATLVEGDTVTSCEPGSELNLSVLNNIPSQELMYEWFPLEIIVGDPFGSTVTVNPTRDTLVSVEVSNQFNCAEILTTFVQVIDLSTLEISADPDTIKQGESSQLEVVGCDDCTYTWSPAGSLDDPTISNPVATPDETTTYTVKVRKGECEEELTVTVTVMPPNCDPDYFIPDAFTPNGDGMNDIFRVRTENYELVRMIVYNRFGQELFISRNIDVGWDGTFNGRQLGPDVFAWYVELRCIGDPSQTVNLQGNVTLLR